MEARRGSLRYNIAVVVFVSSFSRSTGLAISILLKRMFAALWSCMSTLIAVETVMYC